MRILIALMNCFKVSFQLKLVSWFFLNYDTMKFFYVRRLIRFLIKDMLIFLVWLLKVGLLMAKGP